MTVGSRGGPDFLFFFPFLLFFPGRDEVEAERMDRAPGDAARLVAEVEAEKLLILEDPSPTASLLDFLLDFFFFFLLDMLAFN